MKVLFLVGPHASGKTYSAKQYIDNNRFDDIAIIDTGPIMRQLHHQDKPDITIEKWVANLEERFGKNITSVILANKINEILFENHFEKSIIIGYRTKESIEFLIKSFSFVDCEIIYIDADRSLLYSNYQNRENSDKDFEQFNLYLDDELNSGLRTLKKEAIAGKKGYTYFYKNTNEDNLSYLIDSFFGSDKKERVRK